MDDFNNAPNPFDEENNSTPADAAPQQQYNMPGADPYNQAPQQNVNPYNQPYNQTQQQNINPYNQAPQQNMNPYNQPYNQQNYTYNAQNIPQQGYYAPQGYAAPYQQPSTGMAVASLVLGIVSIVMGILMFALPVLFLVPIIGLILGIVFKCKHLPVGKGLSTAGIITSSLGLLIPIALLIFVVAMLLTNGAEVMEFIKQYSPEEYEQLYEMYSEQFPQWFEGAVMMLFRK